MPFLTHALFFAWRHGTVPPASQELLDLFASAVTEESTVRFIKIVIDGGARRASAMTRTRGRQSS